MYRRDCGGGTIQLFSFLNDAQPPLPPPPPSTVYNDPHVLTFNSTFDILTCNATGA